MEEEARNHLERAKKAYKAFKMLREKNLHEDAFSRGFYALTHLIFVLFIKKGTSLPKTYSGVVSRLWAMRKELEISEELISSFSRAQALREKGDYAALAFVNESDLKNIDKLIKNFSKIVGEGLD